MAITPVFLPGESHGRKAWQVIVHRIIESDMTEATQQACTHANSSASPSIILFEASKGKPQSCGEVRNDPIPTPVEPTL